MPFARPNLKMKVFLNMEWLFHRMAHEQSFVLYNEKSHPVRARTREFLLPLIETRHAVLDLGCKEGIMSSYLAEKARKVVGVDYDTVAIDKARRKYSLSNLEFEAVEALEYLTNSKDQFDVLILSHILEHLDEPKEFLVKFKNYFKFIYVEVPDFDRYYMNQYRKDLNMKLVYSDDDHISEFDRDEILSILKEANLQVLSTEHRYGVQKFWCSPIKKG